MRYAGSLVLQCENLLDKKNPVTFSCKVMQAEVRVKDNPTTIGGDYAVIRVSSLTVDKYTEFLS
jgi:hypothetical protein